MCVCVCVCVCPPTRLFSALGELRELADELRGLLVVRAQGEDALVGGVGLQLAGGGGLVVVVVGERLALY